MSIVTRKERVAASIFLRTLGAPSENVDLIAAVVAWMRAESGTTYRGNNPFNLRAFNKTPGPGAIGIRHIKGNGYFNVYATLGDGLRAAANLLIRARKSGHGYGLVIRAAKRGGAGDFLTAVAASDWSSDHYGWSLENPEKNRLLRVYNSITGVAYIPTKQEVHQKKLAKVQANRPAVKPNSTLRPLSTRPYLSAYAIRTSYNETHKEIVPLGDGFDGVVNL